MNFGTEDYLKMVNQLVYMCSSSPFPYGHKPDKFLFFTYFTDHLYHGHGPIFFQSISNKVTFD